MLFEMERKLMENKVIVITGSTRGIGFEMDKVILNNGNK